MPRTLTFIHPAGTSRSPCKEFGAPVDGVYPQLNEVPDFSRWRRTIYRGVNSLPEAFDMLRAESKNSGAFIHGDMRDELPEITRRRRIEIHGAKGTISDAPRIFLMLDIDETPDLEGFYPHELSPETVWNYLRVGLPPEIRRADCILQLSQSFATTPFKVKGHVFVELSRPLTWQERNKLLALAKGIDRRVNQPEQMCFIVDPVFVGCDDPLKGTELEERWFYIEGETRVVEVPDDAELDARDLEAKQIKAREAAAKNATKRPRPKTNESIATREASVARNVSGNYSAGLDWFISQIGDDGHFEGPRMAAARAFVRIYGEDNSELGTFLDAIRARLVTLGQDAGFTESFVNDYPRLISDWRAKLRERELPQPCKWEGLETVSLDVASTELAAFALDATCEALELHEQRVDGIVSRAAVEKLLASGRFEQALAIAQSTGVFEVSPDRNPADVTPSEGWGVTLYQEPSIAPCAVNVTQGVGKTHAGVEMAATAARAGLRVAMLVATHSLARELKGRFAAEGVRAEVWSGESQIGADGEAACPRFGERTELRKAGLPGDMLCGDKSRGFCPLASSCRYRAQRLPVEMADIVLFCGASTLGTKPPAPFRGRNIRREIFDPATGERLCTVTARREPKQRRKGVDYLPPVDMLLIDEPVWTQLIDEQLAPASALADLAASLAGREGSELLAGFAKALVARAGGPLGYWTHGDIAAAVAHAPGTALRARVKAVLRATDKALAKVSIDPAVDVTTGFAMTPEAGRNRLVMHANRIARAMLAAMKAAEGAPGEAETPYLLTIPTDKGLAVQIRHVGSIRREWRQAHVTILDATYREEIARRFLPPTREALEIVAAVPERAMTVRQVFDAQVGVGLLSDLLGQAAARKEGAPLPRRLRDLAAFVEIAAARVYGKGEDGTDFLVVTIKPLADFLTEHFGDRPPAGLEIWHFNNCRGLDEARGAAGIALIGRPLPSPEAAADLASLLTGAVLPVAQYTMAACVYQSATDRRQGFRTEGARSVLLDPFAQTVVDSVCRDALSHAIARVRPVRRPGAGIQAWVLTSEPVPNCPVDAFLRFDELLAVARNPFLIAAARGVFVRPGVNGCGRILSAVTGMDREELKSWRKRDGKAFLLAFSEGANPSYRFLSIGFAPSENGRTPHGEAKGPRSFSDPAVEALVDALSTGTWINVKLALEGSRYAVPVAIRAESLDQARKHWTLLTGRDEGEVLPPLAAAA